MRKDTRTNCVRCGKERPLRAKGLCASCYYMVRFGENKAKIVTCKKCGKQRTHGAKGFCHTCYKVEWAKDYRKKNGTPEKDKIRNKEYGKKYYQLNKESIIKRVHGYYLQNRDKILTQGKIDHQNNKERDSATGRQWRIKNKEKIKINKRDYHVNHREQHRRIKHIRRCRIKNLPATLTTQEWEEILKENNYSCYYCGTSGVPLEQEHRIPVARGGGYTRENIVPSCRPCNISKNSKTDVEFREYLASLAK